MRYDLSGVLCVELDLDESEFAGLPQEAVEREIRKSLREEHPEVEFSDDDIGVTAEAVMYHAARD